MRAGFVEVIPEKSLQEVLSFVLASGLGCLAEVAGGRLSAIIAKPNLLRAANAVRTRHAT